MDKSGTSHYFDFNKFFTTPQIKVFRYDSDGSEQASIDLFATTIHELAHASHWEMCYDYGQYVSDWFINKAIVPESWAKCVEYVITNDIYARYNRRYLDNATKYSGSQFYPISYFKKYPYTPIFIDCIDDYNQREVKSNNTNYPIDRVSGYILSQIEDAIKFGATDTTASGLKAIINGLRRFDNPTNIYLEELFSNYRKLK